MDLRNLPIGRGSPLARGLGGALLLAVMLLAAAHVASGPVPVRIMPLGDSITAGEAEMPPDSYTGYRGPLWSELVADGYHIDFVGSVVNGPDTIDRNHEGHAGYRIDQLLAGISIYLVARPDVILLQAGTNDLLQGISPENASQLLGELLDRIHQLRPNAHIVVASILPIRTSNFFHVSPKLMSDFNSQVAPLVVARAARGWRISHVDMAARVALKPFEFDSLGIHPTQDGYVRMASVWHAELKTILGDTNKSVPREMSTD
jgi:lysophospholipase L1-like esterase